jgi:hypothetical protein
VSLLCLCCPCFAFWGRSYFVLCYLIVMLVFPGRFCVWVWVAFSGRFYAWVKVVPYENATGVAPVYDLVHVDLTVDEGRSGR